MRYEVFKTKKRNWEELVRVLDYSEIIEIGSSFYNVIMKDLKKEKTDGVILINKKGLKQMGTIGCDSKFILFKSFIYLDRLEKEKYSQIEKDNENTLFKKYMQKNN